MPWKEWHNHLAVWLSAQPAFSSALSSSRCTLELKAMYTLHQSIDRTQHGS
jgi:hypothetical protein